MIRTVLPQRDSNPCCHREAEVLTTRPCGSTPYLYPRIHPFIHSSMHPSTRPCMLVDHSYFHSTVHPENRLSKDSTVKVLMLSSACCNMAPIYCLLRVMWKSLGIMLWRALAISNLGRINSTLQQNIFRYKSLLQALSEVARSLLWVTCWQYFCFIHFFVCMMAILYLFKNYNTIIIEMFLCCNYYEIVISYCDSYYLKSFSKIWK